MKTNPRVGVLTVLALSFVGSQAMAGAFALKERSAKAQGLSFAGVSAGSGGLSSAGFNPAVYGLVESREISAGISLVAPNANGEVSIGGVNTGETVDADVLGLVVNSYAGYRLSPKVVAGLSINTPFGLKTEYNGGWTGAADGTLSELLTIQVSPTIAFQPVPNLTLAVAGHIIYADAKLDSSLVELDADAFDVGFAVGALWQATDTTTIGVAYDHGYDLVLKGKAQGLATGGFRVPLKAEASLPETVSLGIVQELNDDFRVMAELQWQNWSVFDALDLTIGGGQVTDPQNYDDAFFVAVGGEYDATNALTFRAGVAWDQSPTTDSNFLSGGTTLGRTVRVPDEDRLWLSLGASYNLTEAISIDAGYSYLHPLKKPAVDLRLTPGTSVEYDGGAHIFSLGGSFRF